MCSGGSLSGEVGVSGGLVESDGFGEGLGFGELREGGIERGLGLVCFVLWLVCVLLVCVVGRFVVAAEAAVAVGVVELAGSAAIGFGAVVAGTFGAVGEDLTGGADLARGGDFALVGGEDDALDAVFEVGGCERASLEVGGGGAVGADDGLGLARLQPALNDGLLDDGKVELDGGAVLRKLEIEAEIAGAFGAIGEAMLAMMEVAIELLVCGGGRVAVVAGGRDMPTEIGGHGVLSAGS